MSARCGCAVDAPEADPALYPCPCGDHCTECHTQDSDCTVDPETLCCTVCGAGHGEPCVTCGGAAYHKPGCKDSDATPHCVKCDETGDLCEAGLCAKCCETTPHALVFGAPSTCPACGRPGIPAGHVCGRCDWED